MFLLARTLPFTVLFCRLLSRSMYNNNVKMSQAYWTYGAALLHCILVGNMKRPTEGDMGRCSSR